MTSTSTAAGFVVSSFLFTLSISGLIVLFVSMSGLQCRYSAGDFGASASFDGRPDVPGFAQLLLEL